MKMIQSKSKKLISVVAMLFMVLFGIMANGCGGGGGGDSYTPPPTVQAPGAPTIESIVETSGEVLSFTLTWSIPTTGGEPTSYEIYRSTTQGATFDPDNHLISIPVTDAGQAIYEFIDNAGIVRGETYYYVVAAKNAGGETPSLEYDASFPGGEVESFGNNFAAALIFADGYGISGEEITGAWTKVVADIDTATGLRPSATQKDALVFDSVETLPYLDPATIHQLNGVDYYKQQTVSTWQGEWQNGKDTEQHVTAAWGDNLISQNLTVSSVIRVEMVLSKALDTNMTSYNMVSLYGTKMNEIQGTDGEEYNNTKAFVFATNAQLTIQKITDSTTGNPDGAAVVEHQPLWECDGPGCFSAEVSVSGNFTYGFVWDLKKKPVPAGIYRITFDLNESPVGTDNNTFIDTVANGTRASSITAYIDVTIH